MEAGAKKLAREIKDGSYTGIEKMVRSATNSDTVIDRGEFEPIARSCTDYSQYGLMLTIIARRLKHHKIPMHLLKSLELLKYLLTNDQFIPTMRKQLIDDLKSKHKPDLDALTGYSDSQWSMMIRQAALEVLDHMNRLTPFVPSSSASSSAAAASGTTSLTSPTATTEASPSGENKTTQLRVKLDGIWVCDCAKNASGTGEHDIVRAVDFYFDSLKSYPSFYTLSDGLWYSSTDCVRKNLVVQTVPSGRGGRVTETNFSLLLAVSQ